MALAVLTSLDEQDPAHPGSKSSNTYHRSQSIVEETMETKFSPVR